MNHDDERDHAEEAANEAEARAEQCPTRNGALVRCELPIMHEGDHAASGSTWRNRRRGAYPEPAPVAAPAAPARRRRKAPAPVKHQHPEGRWAVVYRHGRGTVQVWAWIEDVPAGTRTAAVAEALEQWSRWPSWQRRIAPGGHVDILPAGKLAEGVGPLTATSLDWSDLTPEARKLGLTISAALWADLRAASAEEDQSLAAWCVDALTAAVAAAGAPGKGDQS